MTELPDHITQPFPAAPTRTNRVVAVVEIAMGTWFWAALICMFLTKQHPFLDPFVMWSFRIFVGIFISFILGMVLFSVLYGAREAFRMYLDVIAIGKFGILGRALWAIFFVIAFFIALLLTRW